MTRKKPGGLLLFLEVLSDHRNLRQRQFEKWNVTGAFCGHVHTWDERNYNGVHYLTLDAMCEKNNPEPGDYLVRVHCDADGAVAWSPVHMETRKRK